MNFEVKNKIARLVSDTVANFLYYDRKEDEDIPVGYIEEAISRRELTVDDITAMFHEELKQHL